MGHGQSRTNPEQSRTCKNWDFGNPLTIMSNPGPVNIGTWAIPDQSRAIPDLASFSHPSFTHFTSCFGKPPLQGVPVSGDQKQDSGEEPNFSLAAFRPATAKQVCCSTKKCEFSVPEMEPKNVCIFDPSERPPLLILDFT